MYDYSSGTTCVVEAYMPQSLKTRGYRQKALFTKEIGLRPPRAPEALGMLRLTGILPYIPWFWGVLARFWGACLGYV